MSDLDNELLKVKDFKSVHGHQKKRFIKDKFFLQPLTTSDDNHISKSVKKGG